MRHAPGGPRNRLLDGVVTGREKLRAIHRSLVEVIPEPVFAGLVALCDRMARVPSMLATAERGRSPLGSHIRFIMDGTHGNMIYSTIPPGMVGRAARFRTIDEFWFILSGEGEIWRRAPDGSESVTQLVPGVSIDIALGTSFQYRCTGAEPLVFTCTAMPSWPGDDEAILIDGPWLPHVDP